MERNPGPDPSSKTTLSLMLSSGVAALDLQLAASSFANNFAMGLQTEGGLHKNNTTAHKDGSELTGTHSRAKMERTTQLGQFPSLCAAPQSNCAPSLGYLRLLQFRTKTRGVSGLLHTGLAQPACPSKLSLSLLLTRARDLERHSPRLVLAVTHHRSTQLQSQQSDSRKCLRRETARWTGYRRCRICLSLLSTSLRRTLEFQQCPLNYA